MAEKLLKMDSSNKSNKLIDVLNGDTFWKYLIALCLGAFVVFCATHSQPCVSDNLYGYDKCTGKINEPFSLYSSTPTPTPLPQDGDSTNRPYGDLTPQQEKITVAVYHALGFFKIDNELHINPTLYTCLDKKGHAHQKYEAKESFFHNETQLEALNEGYSSDSNKYCN